MELTKLITNSIIFDIIISKLAFYIKNCEINSF